MWNMISMLIPKFEFDQNSLKRWDLSSNSVIFEYLYNK